MNTLTKNCENCMGLHMCIICTDYECSNLSHWEPKPCNCKKADCILCEAHENKRILADAVLNNTIRESLRPILERKAHEYAIHQGFTDVESLQHKDIKKAYIAGVMLLARNISV